MAAAIEKGKFRTTTELGPWMNFVDGENGMLEGGEDHSIVHVTFSDYHVSSFHYDEETGLYERWSRGEQLKDYKTGELTTVKNVFALATDCLLYPDLFHADITLDGGEGYYASEGKIIPILWNTDENGRFVFTDLEGNELTVNVGKSYICLYDEIYGTTWE